MQRIRLSPLLLSFGFFVTGPAAATPPAPDDPLILGLNPPQAQRGQSVRILGFNFGSAPQVTFNGTPTTVSRQRPDKAWLSVVVPEGATSGPVVVSNTGNGKSSNQADFILVPGTYTPVCTIQGTVRDDTMAILANTLVSVHDPADGAFLGDDVSDSFGHYSIALAPAGDYGVRFVPPVGTRFIAGGGAAGCSGTLDHQFEAGSVLSGSVHENQIPFTASPNALVVGWRAGGVGFWTVTDAGGEFGVGVQDDTYDLLVVGPIGTRQISRLLSTVIVDGDTTLGEIKLDIGWILSGVVWFRDGAATGPLARDLELTYDQGVLAGYTFSIADGSFWLAGSPGSDRRLTLWGDSDLLTLDVQWIDLTADIELDHALIVHSSKAHIKPQPSVIDTDFLFLLEGQPTVLEGPNLGGSSVSVRFPDGMGGWIDGDETRSHPDRGLLLTHVPTGAVSGNVHVRVDGVDGPGYPLTIDPGVHDPGEYTITGTVTDGTDALEGVLVALLRYDCGEDVFADYDVTDAGGAYIVRHATGNHYLYLLPPLSTGFTARPVELPGLTGSIVSNVVLETGATVTGRVVDSGVGPVGAASAPIRNCGIEAESSDHEEWVVSEATGSFTMHLPGGWYELFVEGPSESRYLTSRLDLGDQTELGEIHLDSGYFLQGYVVDETGAGVAGVEVTARQAGEAVGSALTASDAGWFRMAVPAGTFDVDFWSHDDLDVGVATILDVEVVTDTLLHPAIETQPAGHIRGTVYLDDGVTPLPEVDVWAFDAATGHWVDGTGSCADGTYDLRIGAGSYTVMAWPDDECLAFERYPDAPYPCQAVPIAVAPPTPTIGIDFTIGPAGSISGHVIDDWGVGIPEASVCVDGGPASPCSLHCSRADQGGRYVLDRIPVGADYRVRSFSASQPSAPECWNDHPNCVEYDPAPVIECSDTSNVDFTLSDTAGPVPDGATVLGVPLTASYDRASGLTTVHWQPTCNVVGHSLYYGMLGAFGSYAGAICEAGLSGSLDVALPSGDLYFLVVGHSASNKEGSYGLDGQGFERWPAGLGFCGYEQDLSHNCTP